MAFDNRISPDQSPQAMSLYDDYVPGLGPGTYRLLVQQSVLFSDPHVDKDQENGKEKGNGQEPAAPAAQEYHYYQDRRFVVQGPRYAFPSENIQAQFPPEGGLGDYQNFLPHLVLRKRALPWERTVWGSAKDAEPQPWLALLVFSLTELEKAVNDFRASAGNGSEGSNPFLQTLTPADLFAAKAAGWQISRREGGITLLPELEDQGDADDKNSQCQVLDLPLDLFLNLCPRKEDLTYLAHVRCVDPANKTPLNMHAEGDFSVIVGNRLLQEGANIIFLVSLEGWHNLLDGNRQAAGADRVRLISFLNWTVVNDSKGQHTWGELMTGLDQASFGYRAAAGSAPTDQGVAEILSRGYVPVQYLPEGSDNSFAWYRGPLSAVRVSELAQGGLFHRADAALIVDQQTGVMDISYAAAWQLGRLLGMQSTSFGNDLRYFVDQQHDAFEAAHQLADFIKSAHDTPAMQSVWARERNELIGRLQGKGLDPEASEELLDAFRAGGMDREESAGLLTELKEKGISESDLAALEAGGVQKPVDEDALVLNKPQATDNLLHFLARLTLLFPVDFLHLVAHPSLLPRESLRFFYLDNNWVETLVDGAFSVGYNCARDHQVLQTEREDLHKALSRLVYQYHRHLQGFIRELNPGAEAPETYMDALKSGFLLRSDVIAGWPGTEIHCTDKDDKPLTVIRMDQLDSDLLFCLVEGEIDKVTFKEPPEGIRFGLEPDGNIMLRHWKISPPGRPLQDSSSQQVEIPVGEALSPRKKVVPNGPDLPGVLDINDLAGKIRDKVSKAENGTGDGFGSAAFALQMMVSPQSQVITWRTES